MTAPTKPGQKVECIEDGYPRLIRRLAKKEGKLHCIPVVGAIYEVEETFPCPCGACSGIMVSLRGVEPLTLKEAPRRKCYPDAGCFRVVATN